MYEAEAEEALGKWSSSKYAVSNQQALNVTPIRDEDGNIVPSRAWRDRHQGTVDDAWTSDGLAGKSFIYSIPTPKWPQVRGEGTFPDMSEATMPSWFGFEMGTRIQWGTAAFRLEDVTGNMFTEVHGMGGGSGSPASAKVVEITGLISNPQTNSHTYTIKVNDGFCEFVVDHELVSLIASGGEVSDTLYDNTEPYGVAVVPGRVPERMPAFLENPTDNLMEFPPVDVRLSSGLPHPTRTYRLYDAGADTLLTSGTYASGISHKSHPFPGAGYENRTILFRADTAATGGLTVEVYTQDGNWRVIETYDYSAGDAKYISVGAEFPLMRIGYNPDADGASITDAQVSMR